MKIAKIMPIAKIVLIVLFIYFSAIKPIPKTNILLVILMLVLGSLVVISLITQEGYRLLEKIIAVVGFGWQTWTYAKLFVWMTIMTTDPLVNNVATSFIVGLVVVIGLIIQQNKAQKLQKV